jgi:drug/metabolite transporter (DMT)-like permease
MLSACTGGWTGFSAGKYSTRKGTPNRGCIAMKHLSDNMRGALFMMLSMAGYVFNDAMVKLLSSSLGLFQTVFLRGMIVATLLGLFAWIRGDFSKAKTSFSIPLVLRVIGEIGGTIFFLTALFNMPIANVTAILQVLPLAVTLASALLLGEQVGWRRYGAIGIGFIGVLIIVRPGSDGFNFYSLMALGAVACIVLRDIATRRLPVGMPSVLVGFYTSIAVTLMAAIAVPFQPWHSFGLHEVSILTAASLFIFVGTIFSVMTMRVGEVSFITPFRYTILIWAILLGIVFFDDYPDGYTILGSFIVVAMGIYTFYRERAIEQKRRNAR